jgi:hypothetical protein
MRQEAYERRKRREEIHLIGVRNEIRGALGSEPLSKEDIYGQKDIQKQDEEEIQALKYRMRERGVVEWDKDMTQ